MALIVEDGTAKTDSESYISVADATTYLDARGLTAFGLLATDALKEQALRKATDYMTQKYTNSWTGVMTTTTQALDFPRDYMPRPLTTTGTLYYDNDIVPTEVQRACALLANKSITETLNDDIDRQTTMEKVGDLEVRYTGYENQQKTYSQVEDMLKRFLAVNTMVKNEA